MKLTDEERDAIGLAFDAWGHDYTLLFPEIEAIVARHVKAALNEAADQITAELICCDVFERLHNKTASQHSEEQKVERRMHAICYWGEAAARIVRAAADTT